ncbi:triose-phosphate isomerase [Malassezia sp. CBS 17886]|nr:triose-phosphate isomerase [Malassezia sp. CBS 17886]
MPAAETHRSAPGAAARSPPRRRLVGTSLKMYFDYAKTQTYVRDLVALSQRHAHFPILDASGRQALDIFVIPDFVSIVPMTEQLQKSTTDFWPGAQDTFDEDAGAFTGEVSPRTLAQVGCRIVEIGHAERRRQFGETDAWVARKAAAVVRNGMSPLVCIGELTRTSDTELAVDECWAQVQGVLGAVEPTAEVVLAYEPVWAIGQKEPASAEHIVHVTRALRSRCLAECAGRPDASLRILYGGSAGPHLYEKIYEGVDGLFLGRFAHDPAVFLDTVLEVYGAGRRVGAGG